MMQVSGREFARRLEKLGWTLLRVRGSHRIYGTPGSMARLFVPIHGNQPLKIGLLNHLLKKAGLSIQDQE